MANRIQFAVSATPIVTATPSEGTEVDTIAGAIGKTLSASGTVLASNPDNTLAFAGDVLSNINVTTATSLVAANASTAGVWVKHRGVTDTGAATTAVLTVLVGAQVAALLQPNEGLFLPRCPTAVTGTSSSGTISVEVADID